jgi:hypothetical protein
MHCIAENPMKISLSDFWISEFSKSTVTAKQSSTIAVGIYTLSRCLKVVYALIFELQMNEIMSNTPENKKTTPRYDNSFKKSWTSSYPFIKASRKGVNTHCNS